MSTINIPISRQTFSHNLLTPLAGILGNIHLLAHSNLALTPKQEACLKDLSLSGDDLLKFANCLIDQSQDSEETSSNEQKVQKNSNLRILLVEDESIVQRVETQILENLNCTVDIASNGYEALELLNSSHDVVLMDIHMPGMDGIETTLKIRQISTVPIIGVTAYKLEELETKCKEAGFNDVINKPIDVNKLQNILQNLVKK